MRKARVWIEIAAVVVVGAAAFFAGRRVFPMVGGPSPISSSGLNGAVITATRGPVPDGVTVPDAASTDVPADVVKPDTVKPASGTSSVALRDFNVVVHDGLLAPNTFLVRVDDILNITFTSRDNTYAFVQPDYALNWQVSPASPKSLQFQTDQIGKFIFYCPACGGPAKGPVGYIIVVSK